MKDRQVEARLVGLIRLINGIAADLAWVSGDNLAVHAERLAHFNDLTTGGEYYEIDDRPINTSRAIAV